MHVSWGLVKGGESDIPWYKKRKVSNVACVLNILFSIYPTPLQMICIWYVISLSGGNLSHMVASILMWTSLNNSIFYRGGIKVRKEESGTSASNQAYDKFQINQDKLVTSQLLKISQQKVHVCIKKCRLVNILSIAIQNISTKIWTYSFVSVNIHPHHHLYFSECIKKILTDVKTVKTVFFRNHRGVILMPCHLFEKRHH